jgi:hypothetical protein
VIPSPPHHPPQKDISESLNWKADGNSFKCFRRLCHWGAGDCADIGYLFKREDVALCFIAQSIVKKVLQMRVAPLPNVVALRFHVLLRVTQAAEQRLSAQNEQNHWAKKLLDEEKKVRDAKKQLNIVQQEFEASRGCTLSGSFLRCWHIGMDRRSSTLLMFLILGRSRPFSPTWILCRQP